MFGFAYFVRFLKLGFAPQKKFLFSNKTRDFFILRQIGGKTEQ